MQIIPPLGIVEGFFGPAWSWQARAHAIDLLRDWDYRNYLYAPKSDAALRRHWQLPFTPDWTSAVTSFNRQCRAKGVAFGVGLSPYGLYESFNRDARQTFTKKLDEIKALELDALAIFFDDMHASDDMTATQAEIVNLAHSHGATEHLLVCPSYYSDDIVLDRVFSERPHNYLRELCASIDSSIEVFWTGEEVCARQFDAAHLDRVADEMGRKPTLWDNYPVNDGPRMSDHLHLRAVTGRGQSVASRVAAHYINPALQPTLSLIPAITLSMSYRRGERYVYGEAFAEAAEIVVGKALALKLREDLLALQDLGRAKMDASKIETIRDRYRNESHPAARELIAWLDGHYRVSAEDVQTQ
ncbi:MAG: beta-N-acetylglucosaminidase domain-containing protein [Casimicrobium sp.]